MKRFKFLLVFFSAFFTLIFNGLFAQNNFKSEEDLKKQANIMFEDEKYAECAPLFSQLLSLNPQDPDFNYKYGTCILYSGEDKEKPLSYLDFASKKPNVNNDVFFQLGKAFQLNYRFGEAVVAYTNFKKSASAKEIQKRQVDHAIEECNNGRNLLSSITRLTVLDKKDIKQEDFYISYDLGDLGGKLVVKPEDFMSPVDIKKGDKSLMFISPGASEYYFSSYGESEKNSRDIYKVVKLPSGEFSKPMNLGPTINTPYDDDYPYMHPNGLLYFASKGHNSMGGYDIFRTRFDATTNSWSTPQNLDFAINSPDDDIMFVTDKDNTLAYFASKRSNVVGRTHIYKIHLEAAPVELILISGKLKLPEGSKLLANITVKDIDNGGKTVGVYRTKEKNGSYLLNVPNGGNFEFIVDAPGFPSLSQNINVPKQESITKILKQEISPKADDPGALTIINKFDDTSVDDQQAQTSLAFIKEQASLNVNVDEQPIDTNTPAVKDSVVASSDTSTEVKSDSLAASAANTATDTTSSAKNNANNTAVTNPQLSDSDLIKIAYDDAKDLQQEANELKSEAKIAEVVAQRRKENGQTLLAKANEAKTAGNPDAEKLITDAQNALKEATVAQTLAENLSKQAEAKQSESDAAMTYANDLESAVKSNTGKEAIARLTAQRKEIETTSSETGAENKAEEVKANIDKKQEELSKQATKLTSLKNDIKDIETEQSTLSAEKNKTKDKQTKDSFEAQINELTTELADKKKQLDEAIQQENTLKAELIAARQEADILNNIVSEIKSTDTSAVTATLAANNNSTNTAATNTATNPAATNTSTAANTTQADNTISEFPVSATISPEANKELTNKSYLIENNALLIDAGKITNETEREKTKLALYQDMDNALAIDLTVSENKLKDAPEDQKAGLKEVLAELEKISADNKQKLDATQAKVNQLTGATTSSATKDSTASTSVNTTAATGAANTISEFPVSPTISPAARTELSNKSYLIENNNLLVEANKKTNELDREKTKLTLYQDIDNSLIIDISVSESKLKDALEEQKTELNEVIAELKKIAADNKQKLDATQAKVNSLEGTAAVKDSASVAITNSNATVNNTGTVNTVAPENKTTVTIDYTQFEQQASSANMIADEKQRDSTLKKINEQWLEKINADIQNTKAEISKPLDDSSRAVLQTKMAGLELKQKERTSTISYINSKQTLAANNAVNNTNNAAVSADTAKSPVNTEVAKTTASSDSSLTVADTTTNKNISVAKQAYVPQPNLAENLIPAESNYATVKYTSPEAAKVLEGFKELNNQQILQQQKSDSLNLVIATTTDASQKEVLQLQRLSAQLKADDAKTSLVQLVGEANAKEYSSNKSQLDAAIARNSDNGSDEATIANMQVEEANNLFTEAKALRELVKSNPDPTAQRNARTRAYELEALAIEKQEKAKETFAKAEQNFKPANGTLTAANTNANLANTNLASNASTNNTNANNTTAINPTPTNTSTVASIDTTTEYINYVALKTESQRLKAISDSLKILADSSLAVYNRDTTNADNKAKSAELKNKADESLADYNAKQTETEKYLEIIGQEKANLVLASVNSKTNNSITQPSNTLATTNNESKTVNNTVTAPIANNTLKPVVAPPKLVAANNSEIVLPNNFNEVDAFFEKKSAPVYSEEKPIPLDVKLPEGLIFKVQIGAFRKPIPQDLFTGFNPVMGERVGNGITRYTAGLFKKLNVAENALKEIKAIGYKDAFIVAFMNGKRIPIEQAIAMSNGSVNAANTTETLASNATNQNNTNVAAENSTALNNNAAASNQVVNTNTAASKEIAKPAAVLNNLQGLLYTVQIGVYSKPVTRAQLFNIDPIFSENTPNGYLRYTSGIYNNLNIAATAKARAVQFGVKDAFVIAYQNGKRIPMSDAKRISDEQGDAAFVKSPDVNKLPVISNNGPTTIQPVNTTNVPATTTTPEVIAPKTNETTNSAVEKNTNNTGSQSNDVNQNTNNQISPPAINAGSNFADINAIRSKITRNDTGVVFKVQIGAYKLEVPNEMAVKYIAVASKGVDNYVEANGLNIYVMGFEKTYAGAVELKKYAVSQGIVDAFIIAYRNGQRIDVEEAKKLIKE